MAIVQHMVRMRNSTGVKRCHAINFVVANIASYNLILGMAWLRKQNPDIRWDTSIWHWRTRTNVEDGPFRLVSASAFIAMMRAERTQAYKLHLTNFLPEIGCASVGNVPMATGPERTVPDAYKAYAGVFSEADFELLPTHGLQDLLTELLDGKQLLWDPIYNLSQRELETLRSYL
jgi:hypothetical protein